MEFVCLAAGKGSRLGRLGAYLQKAMYPVGLKPFLQHTLEQLVLSGVPRPGARLVLVVGHHAEQVRAYFGRRFEGLRISYVTQEPPSGTGHALSLAASQLSEGAPVLAWQADLFVPGKLFAALAAHPGANVVTLGAGHQDEPGALRATISGQRVTRVWEGQGPLLDIGAWKLSADVLGRLATIRAPGGEYRMLPNLQRLVDDGLEVGFVTSDEWVHLGGTLPSAEENVRAVTRRVWSAAPTGGKSE